MRTFFGLLLGLVLCWPIWAADDVSVVQTSTPVTITSTDDFANLARLNDGDVVILATTDGGLFVYDSDGTHTVDNVDVFNGPESVGRYVRFNTGATESPITSDPSIIVAGSGDASADATALSAAVAQLNAAGCGTLWIDGTVIVNTTQAFTGPINVRGLNREGVPVIESRITTADPVFSWNDSWAPAAQSTYSITTPNAFSEYFTSSAHDFSEGDWVVLWSNDQITGVPPHYGTGMGQHPMELHQVQVWDDDNSRAYVEGFVVDQLTEDGLALACVCDMDEGVLVDNLKFTFTGTQADYAVTLKFQCIENVVVADTVQFDRTSPGCVSFNFCANSVCRAHFDGTAADDGVYHVVAGVVNGLLVDGVYRGGRHVFTTTSGDAEQLPNATTPYYTISAVNSGTDTLTIGSHGLSVGDAVEFDSVSGTAPANLSEDTVYWVHTVSGDDVKLKSTVGGGVHDIGSPGEGSMRLYRQARWGTPLGVRCHGVAYVTPRLDDTTWETHVCWDTHAEGWGIVCAMQFNCTGYAGVAAQTRSRATLFQDCYVWGGRETSSAAKGIRTYAADTRIQNCHFEDLWLAVSIESPATNTDISHCTFEDIKGPAVYCVYGSDHTVRNNAFRDCAGTASGSPFLSKSVLWFDTTGDGIRVANNDIPLVSNDFSIDANQSDADDITVEGNVLKGYGTHSAGFGRTLAASSVSAAADTITFASAHGYADDDIVRLTTTAGDPPGGLTVLTDYYVIATDSTTIQLAATAGGAAINITDAGTGTHSIENGEATALELAYRAENSVDTGTTAGKVHTTDATATAIVTIDTDSDACYLIVADVVGTESVDHDEVAGYRVVGTFKNDNNTLTKIGSTVTAAESTGAWDCDVDASDDDIRVVVTGAGGTEVDWECTATLVEIE